MTPYFEDDHVRIYAGDCREVVPGLEAVDAVVTDPPYGLGFMGKDWDHGVPGVHFWEIIRARMKPGAHLVAFGGTRTFHRLMVAIEDAGFEIRDTLMWVYGSGFPKSLDVGKAIDRQRYDRDQIYTVTAWIRAARDAAGIGNADIDAAFGFHGMAGHWTSSASQPAVPTLEQVPRLLEVLGSPGIPDEIATLLIDLNGRKGQPGEAWFRREVVGQAVGKNAVDGDLYRPGSGTYIPKTYDLTAPATPAAQQWDGWGTALKPSWEPIVLARNPLAGTVAETVQRYGTGALHIAACRVGTEERHNTPASPTSGHRKSRVAAGYRDDDGLGPGSAGGSAIGRWPANLVHDGSPDVLAGFPDEAGGGAGGPIAAGAFGRQGIYSKANGALTESYADSGSAARFFYTAKASRSDRGEGNDHPTVKPVSLMRWLCRLITPPGGVILDPFMGSGTTLVAAREEFFKAVGVDLEADHCRIAASRLAQGVLALEVG